MQHFRSLSKWQLMAYAIGFGLSLPMFFLIFESLSTTEAIFDHLWDTVLWDYILNTLLLLFGVALCSSVIAIPLGWLVASCDFPFKKQFEWALMLPLAMPAYIIAYVYTDLLDYAGPVQISLREWFGWQSPADYWFFDIRSLGGAIVMLSLVLYPYLYLLFKTALKEQSGRLLQAARIMGASPWQCFYRVSIPLARGAIAAAIALICMEAMADFATVSYFSVSTLTTAVYDTWFGYYSLTAAAKISAVMLLLVFLAVATEKYSRRHQAVYDRTHSLKAEAAYQLTGWQGAIAAGFCGLILLIAFVVPVWILVGYAIDYFAQSWNADFFNYALQSLQLAFVVSLVCVLFSVLTSFYVRLSGSAHSELPAKAASMGYALPGTVLAIAVLLPLTALDHGLNNLLAYVDMEVGLIFSGTVFAIGFAYVVRFFAISYGAVENSFARISPSLDMASRSMGKPPFKTLCKVHLPLLQRGIWMGILLVFIECMKELPAALLLRPFDFETLATYVFQYISDEQLEHASLAALCIVLVGLLPLYLINRSMEQSPVRKSA